MERLRTKKAIARKDYPYFATFRDLNDPTTVARVSSDRFEEVFGAGVQIKGVTVELVDEPMTWGIVDSQLPWLASLNGRYLTGKSSSGGELYGLHAGDFKKGDM